MTDGRREYDLASMERWHQTISDRLNGRGPRLHGDAFFGRIRRALSAWPRYRRHTRIAGAVVDAVLGKGISSLELEILDPQVLGPRGRACLDQHPRVAAIFAAARTGREAIEGAFDAAGLSGNEREVARLVIVDDLSHDEIEGVIGQPLPTVAGYASRAGDKLRALATENRRTCAMCGELFEWRRKSAAYCSHACREKAHRARRAA